MILNRENYVQTVPAVHGLRPVEPDPPFEIDLSRHVSKTTLLERC